MRKTVLNRLGLVLTVAAIGLAAVSSVQAQSGSAVDRAFAKELNLVEGLKVYNRQLADQIKAQAQAKAEIQKSIAGAGELAPQVAPILKNMLAALEQFVRADLPFHKQERLESIGELKALMVNPDAKDSDRFRNIMDIYTVETEYGTTTEAYPGQVTIEGVETPVDFLRIGRLGYYYQTNDQKTSARWDQSSKSWETLPSSANRDIRKAIKVAAKLTAPELISLPISAPEGS